MRELHGDAIPRKDFADHVGQVAIVLDDEDARLFARSAKTRASSPSRASSLSGRATQPETPGRLIREDFSAVCGLSTLSRTTGVRASGSSREQRQNLPPVHTIH